MMNISQKVIILLLLIVSSFGCNSDIGQTRAVAQNEDFDVFFKKFSSDSIFQFSRVKFPLVITHVDEYDKKTTTIILKNEWKYYNFLKDKDRIVKKKVATQNAVNIDFSINETGVQVQYYFKKRNQKWYLTLAEDQSD